MTVDGVRREHVEAFIEAQLAGWTPSTAASHYRYVQQSFRWLEEEGEVPASPMARRSRPPYLIRRCPCSATTTSAGSPTACRGSQAGSVTLAPGRRPALNVRPNLSFVAELATFGRRARLSACYQAERNGEASQYRHGDGSAAQDDEAWRAFGVVDPPGLSKTQAIPATLKSPKPPPRAMPVKGRSTRRGSADRPPARCRITPPRLDLGLERGGVGRLGHLGDRPHTDPQLAPSGDDPPPAGAVGAKCFPGPRAPKAAGSSGLRIAA